MQEVLDIARDIDYKDILPEIIGRIDNPIRAMILAFEELDHSYQFVIIEQKYLKCENKESL